MKSFPLLLLALLGCSMFVAMSDARSHRHHWAKWRRNRAGETAQQAAMTLEEDLEDAFGALLDDVQQAESQVGIGSSVGSDACGGNDYGTAGDFDFYVFATSWPAQFCQAHESWPGCENPTNWQVHNLTLHGMWPNYNSPQDGHSWPQCCDSSYGSDIDPNVAAELLPEFQRYWPNEEDPSGSDLSASLWNHEWGKHGTCSGLPQKTYFETAMNLLLSMPTPSVITGNIGGSCALSDLQAAYGASSCEQGGDCIVGFNCDSQNGELYLSGVTSCWDTNLNQITCPAAVLGSQGSQCTDDTVYIQSF